LSAGMINEQVPLCKGGKGSTAYAQAVGLYLSFAISKIANTGSTIASWMNDRGALRETFARQAIPMVWSFAEANPFSNSGGNLMNAIRKSKMVIESLPSSGKGKCSQADATTQLLSTQKIISTDPPYYDNIGYADLSDFFYVWLRYTMKSTFQSLFSTVAVPKSDELVASISRHGNRKVAEIFFLDGMIKAMKQLRIQAHPNFPVTIYYAFKQSEKKVNSTTISTGWETFLESIIKAGFSITGTLPMRTEGTGRINAIGSNALASSIILVCHSKASGAMVISKREFLSTLKEELPSAITLLKSGNIAPVDLAQAAIGPGMKVYTRYAKVLDAAGNRVTVRDALAVINEILDEVMAEQEGDIDGDSRWALAWFQQYGFLEGEYGTGDTLSKAKNTSIDGMVEAGILTSQKGKVRLLRPNELPHEWDPITDSRLTVWEVVHHLIRILQQNGEESAGNVAARLNSTVIPQAHDLCYKLFIICDRKKFSEDALAYNTLVQSWPEIMRIARSKKGTQSEIFEENSL